MSGPLSAILYGLRFATAVCLALWLAFYLQLDQAYWAGTSAALVCQPVLGSSLRKGLFRVVGTILGAVAIVIIMATFPQDRVGFTLALAGWCAFCCFAGSHLEDFAAYGAVLSGYTAAIVASSVVDAPDTTFDVALTRASEIIIGVAAATAVLSLTDLGTSRRKLALALAELATTARSGLAATLAHWPDGLRDTGDGPDREVRRLAELAGSIASARGEGAYWRFKTGPVRAALDGLFLCAASQDLLRREIAKLDKPDVDRLRHAFAGLGATDGEPAERGKAAQPFAVPAADPIARAARAVAAGLDGAAAAFDVSRWLETAQGVPPHSERSHAPPRDPLPSLLNALRAFVALSATTVFWMLTRWPNGPGAIAFAAISVLLLSLNPNGAVAATGYGLGTLLTVIVAAVVRFAVLPQMQSPGGLYVVLFVMIVPMAALSTLPQLKNTFGPAAANLLPVFGPSNVQGYDTVAFYNSTSAILGGCLAGAICLRLVAPLTPAWQARRILDAADADCAALELGWSMTRATWCGRMRARAVTLPASADKAAFRQLVAAFIQGGETIRWSASRPGARA